MNKSGFFGKKQTFSIKLFFYRKSLFFRKSRVFGKSIFYYKNIWEGNGMEETNTSGTENNVENGTPETGGGTSASTQTNMSATIQEVLTDIITSDASANVQESIDSKVLKAVKETFEENEDIKDLVNFKKLTLNMFNEEKTEKIEPIEDFVHKLLLVDEKFKNDFGSIEYDNNIAKVSIVGVGMKSHSGVASTAFKALAEDNINIMMISTSEIKISMIINAEFAQDAVRKLHSVYRLEE